MNVVFCYHTTDMEYHLGIAFLSAALQPLEVNTRLVIFREIAGRPVDSVHDIAQRILTEKPEIVAFSIMTFNWRRIQEVITALRPGFEGVIVVGGCHAMLCPDEVLRFPGVDAVCLGEGEKPLQELVEYYRNRPLHSTPVIEGFCFKQSDRSKVPAPWCNERLEDYPYLSYDMFDAERNQPLIEKVTGSFHPAGVFSLAAITSRGCPYKCTYCNNHSIMNILGGPKRFLRQYPVDKAIAGIKGLVNRYHPEFIEFIDEMFIQKMSWMESFCAAYKNEIGLPYSINMRIDRSSDELIRILAESGLKLVFFGLESGDETYRSTNLDRHMSDDDILRGADILRKYGVIIISYNMFGMPLETREMLQKTISLNRKLQPDAVCAFVYQPLPNTKLGQLAFEHNLVKPPPEDYWDFLVPSLDSPELPAVYIQEQVELFRQEFNSPERVNQCFTKLRSFVGKK
jgi:anaerobic magnesium-protoporphyrin IX monomethyl ester cyclase